jgi:hypothetical protein
MGLLWKLFGSWLISELVIPAWPYDKSGCSMNLDIPYNLNLETGLHTRDWISMRRTDPCISLQDTSVMDMRIQEMLYGAGA